MDVFLLNVNVTLGGGGGPKNHRGYGFDDPKIIVFMPYT